VHRFEMEVRSLRVMPGCDSTDDGEEERTTPVRFLGGVKNRVKKRYREIHIVEISMNAIGQCKCGEEQTSESHVE
jgi:hypothetical protein